MRKLRRWLVIAVGTVVVLNALSPDDAASPVSSNPTAIEKPADVMFLTNDPDKAAAIQTLPTPASLPAPGRLRPTIQEQTYVYVTGSRVNLREGPDVSTKRIGAFDRGTKLVVLDVSNGWTHVTGSIAGSPKAGWMSSKYLEATRPQLTALPPAKPKRSVAIPSTGEITAARKELIAQSSATYPGNCPCPYNRDRAGRKCGKRSAWSKPGGRSPLCYESDITRSHLAGYFKRIGRQYP